MDIWYIIGTISLVTPVAVYSYILLKPILKRRKFIKDYVTKNIPYIDELIGRERASTVPIFMYDIRSNSPLLMPSDSGKTCIFFVRDQIIIKKIQDSSFELTIDATDIKYAYGIYNDYFRSYYISIDFKNDQKESYIAFDTAELKDGSPRLLREYKAYFNPEEFLSRAMQYGS